MTLHRAAPGVSASHGARLATPAFLGLAAATLYGPTFLVPAGLAGLGCVVLVGGRRSIDPAAHRPGAVA